MKRILVLLALLLFFLPKEKAEAQVHLRIDALVNFPDSANQGDIAFVTAIVQNVGNAPFQGMLSIAMINDSTFDYLYQNAGFTFTILPGDTISLSPPNGYQFDSSVFRQGNNVVVVWPYTAQSIIADTMTKNVWFNANAVQPVPEIPGFEGLMVYPNPASSFIQIYSPKIPVEDVRIYSVEGKLLLEENLLFQNHRLSLECLEPGAYHLELSNSNGNRSVIRLIRTR